MTVFYTLPDVYTTQVNTLPTKYFTSLEATKIFTENHNFISHIKTSMFTKHLNFVSHLHNLSHMYVFSDRLTNISKSEKNDGNYVYVFYRKMLTENMNFISHLYNFYIVGNLILRLLEHNNYLNFISNLTHTI